MNKFALLIFLLMLLPLASAEYYTGQDADIRVPVRINGAPSSTMLCNITVYNPNNIVLVSFKEMTNDYINTKTHNYTLPASNTTQIGEYCSDITCSDDGLNKTQSYCININKAGKSTSLEESLLYIAILAVLFILFGIVLYGAFKIPFENIRGEFGEITKINYKKYTKIACIAASYIIFVWIIYICWNISYGFLQLQMVSYLFQVCFTLLIGFAIPIFLFIFVFSIIVYIRENKIAEAINRNLTIR